MSKLVQHIKALFRRNPKPRRNPWEPPPMSPSQRWLLGEPPISPIKPIDPSDTQPKDN